MDLHSAAQTFASFREQILIEADGQVVPFTPDDWQADDMDAITPAISRIAGRWDCRPVPHNRFYLERPRGHSKTSDIAMAVAWTLFASTHPIRGVCAAADRDQSKLVRDAIQRLAWLNPELGNFVEISNYKIVNPHTGATVEILSADAASSYGLLVDFIVADELSVWSGRGLWDSLLSAAAKRSTCVLIVISNAGFHGEWQEAVREHAQQSESWHFNSLSGPVASWISEAMLEEQRQLLPPSQYKRLWLNEWASESGGDALSEELIALARRQPCPIRSRISGFAYLAGVDLGVRRDSSAVVVVAVDHEARLIRLADVEVWRPSEQSSGQVDLAAVEHHIGEMHQRYELLAAASDSWQSEAMGQALRYRGIPFTVFSPTAQIQDAQARCLLQVFQDQRITLYDDADMLRDLSKLRIAERPTGGLRLSAPRDEWGHSDSAFALCAILPTAVSVLNGMYFDNEECETTFVSPKEYGFF